MKRVMRWALLGLIFGHLETVQAGLQLFRGSEVPAVFSRDSYTITNRWHNDSNEAIDIAIRARLFQTSSSTAAPLSDFSEKRIRMLPGQTVLETFELTVPEIKGETLFLIQWLTGVNQVLGTARVLVYPTNLLTELRALVGIDGLGVFDPDNRIKPSLQALGILFVDLEVTDVRDFRGRLLLLGPFSSKTQMADELTDDVRSA